jgi:hypothetical protein
MTNNRRIEVLAIVLSGGDPGITNKAVLKKIRPIPVK